MSNNPEIQTLIDETVDSNVKLYGAQPVMLDYGQGCYAYDTEGGKYLDFAAGIAVASLGHAHPKLTKTIADQSAKMMACQGSYMTHPRHKASKLLIDAANFDEIYFANSGTECVEMSLKMARKWAYDTKGEGANEIITFRNSFHGRTYGAASITEKRLSQPFFEPYLQNVHFADFNSLSSVEALINAKTACVIVEPVQGEGGLTPATPEFLRGLRQLCDQHNVALIFDEIQCGAGRLATVFGYESFQLDGEIAAEPDIICMAKGIGSGSPVGLVMAKKQFAKAMVIGTHGSTYGANPLACAVVSCVFEEISDPEFIKKVQETAKFFQSELEGLKSRSNKIVRIAGKGMMIGLETAVSPVKEVIGKLRENGLMTTQAGSTLVRLTPPLIVEKEQISEAVSIIEKTLKEDC